MLRILSVANLPYYLDSETWDEEVRRAEEEPLAGRIISVLTIIKIGVKVDGNEL